MKTRMYIQWCAAVALAFAVYADNICAQENPFELFASFCGISPARNEDWSGSSGLEIQGRLWQNEHIALALSVGSDLWNAKKSVSEFDDGSVYSYTAINGDATLMNLGGSLLYRSGGVLLELGLRYASVDSSIYVDAIYDGPDGSDSRYEKIDIADTFLFVARLGVELEMAENIMIIPYIGYQVDLGKPEERFAGESLGETDFRAVTYGLGFSCKL